MIKFCTWGSASEMKIIAPLISEFERRNSDVKIELMHIPQDYFKKLHLLFASNMAPDVVFINNLNLPVYSKFLIDLNEYADKSLYFPQAIEAMSVDNCLYAIPRDVSTLMVYYNKDLFDKYGVSYPKKEWSIEDLTTISRSLTRNGVWGISFEPKIYNALPYAGYYGVYEVEKLSPETKGIALYKALAHKYHYAPTEAQTGSKTQAQMFLEGKIALHLSGRWMVPKYRECANFNWDVVNFPHYSASSDASGWAVSKQSKNKEQAIKFVLYLSSYENILKMTADGLIVPARKDVAQSKSFLSGKPEHSELFIEGVNRSKPTVVTKNYIKITDKLNDEVFSSR